MQYMYDVGYPFVDYSDIFCLCFGFCMRCACVCVRRLCAGLVCVWLVAGLLPRAISTVCRGFLGFPDRFRGNATYSAQCLGSLDNPLAGGSVLLLAVP